MSGKQLISIDAKDPEYYAELLRKTSRLANQCLPSDERPDVDSLLDRHLTLLDVLADISLCQRGNVSATMASLKEDNGTLETQLYIIFNHKNNEAAHCCPQHLEAIINMLREVRYMPPAMDGSPKVIDESLEIDLIEICRAIPQLFIRHFRASRYRAQEEAFGHSGVHRAGSDILRSPSNAPRW
jgi:hypothetical protein